MAGSQPASAPQRSSAWAAAFASVARRTTAPGKADRTSRPSGRSLQPSMVGASSTRSSNGIPKVDTPTAAISRPGAGRRGGPPPPAPPRGGGGGGGRRAGGARGAGPGAPPARPPPAGGAHG